MDLAKDTCSQEGLTPEQIRHHLHEFFTWCAEHDHIPELVTLARTIDQLVGTIITAIELGVSKRQERRAQPDRQTRSP